LALLAWRTRKAPPLSTQLHWSLGALALFSVSYSAISVHYGLWQLGGRDLLDLVSMLLLPVGCVWIGARAAAVLSWRQMSWLWLAYGLGALVYVWIVLLQGRVFCPDGGWLELWLRRREATISAPWGPESLVNVRSVEQNAALACAWLLPGLCLLRRSVLSWVLSGAGVLGWLATVCFGGRLGWLVLALGALPVAMTWVTSRQRQQALGLVLLTGSTALALAVWRFPRLGLRLYDERFDRFAGFFPVAPQFPWGGNTLSFQSRAMAFDASQGELMHNVFMDLYVRVGWLPLLLLLLALVPLLLRAFACLALVLRQEKRQLDGCIAAGFLLCLSVQWLFQPLLYGDGLLFYVGFLLIGTLAGEPSLRGDEP
jgi:hypothetical protein